MEARPRQRCARARRARHAGRRSDRCARRGTPTRGLSRAPRSTRCAGSRICRAQISPRRCHRSLPHPCPTAGRRNRGRLGHCRADFRPAQTTVHPDHRDRGRPRRRRARIGAVVDAAGRALGAGGRASPARAAHASRRDRCPACPADSADGPCPRRVAARSFPAIDQRRRDRSGAARRDALRRRRNGCRSLLRNRTVRAAACAARARARIRQ